MLVNKVQVFHQRIIRDKWNINVRSQIYIFERIGPLSISSIFTLGRTVNYQFNKFHWIIIVQYGSMDRDHFEGYK